VRGFENGGDWYGDRNNRGSLHCVRLRRTAVEMTGVGSGRCAVAVWKMRGCARRQEQPQISPLRLPAADCGRDDRRGKWKCGCGVEDAGEPCGRCAVARGVRSNRGSLHCVRLRRTAVEMTEVESGRCPRRDAVEMTEVLWKARWHSGRRISGFLKTFAFFAGLLCSPVLRVECGTFQTISAPSMRTG